MADLIESDVVVGSVPLSERIASENRRLPAPRTAASAKSLIAAAPEPFGPRTITRLRTLIATGLAQAVPHALEVVEGKRTWTVVQAQVFRTLLSRVIPEVSQQHATVEHTFKQLGQLSREELEALVSEDSKLIEGKTEPSA